MDTTLQTDTGTPAEVYERQFVPALFAPYAEQVASAACIATGQAVLDVACGTGALTCTVATRAGRGGHVVGLDANPDMLAVARRKPVAVEWVEGRAESLPFADARFNAVVSQFGLMFFEDRVAALREMRRVLRPAGRLAVAVCDDVAHSPGYQALVGLLQRLFGNHVADAFRAPFVLGDRQVLRELCVFAGLHDATVDTIHATVRFPSIDALVSTERACIWTLGGLLDDTQFERLRDAAHRDLEPFAGADGTVAFDMPALLIRATATS